VWCGGWGVGGGWVGVGKEAGAGRRAWRNAGTRENEGRGGDWRGRKGNLTDLGNGRTV